MVVGITGGIGSGKSTVTALFKGLDGVVVYIADEKAKELMNTSLLIKESIVKEFGQEAYMNGHLNREHLAKQVFNNKEKLARLNAIVHPEVHRHFKTFVAQHSQSIIIYENAILFEIGSDRFCDVIITIFVPEKERIQRVIKRDKTSEKEVRARIKNQWPDQKKTILSNYVIFNDIEESLSSQVQQIHNILTKKLSYI